MQSGYPGDRSASGWGWAHHRGVYAAKGFLGMLSKVAATVLLSIVVLIGVTLFVSLGVLWWTGDGTRSVLRIAFTSEGTENNSEIYVMNADGSGLTKLTTSTADDAFPAWRP
jgi:hypothetical protein